MKPNQDLHTPLLAAGFNPVGRMRPRTARDISRSPWGIGCETVDRDYVDFAQVEPHLGELGATQVRLQAGWAKCDPGNPGNSGNPGDGRYQWDWLDAVVDGCVAQGLRPWLQTSYGNPAYPGGGGIGLKEGIPTSPEALAAWDRWVRALAERYRDRVNTWEIWNEPDHGDAVPVEAYTAFFIRTAVILREVQREARIVGLALAGNMPYAERFLHQLAADGRSELLDEVSFHFYPHNPDEEFERVEQLAALLKEHAPHATLRQGETGSPSETLGFLALGKHDWSERKQAVWNTRRLMAHHVRGIPMSLFQIADMYYSKQKGLFEGRNPKGLLSIREDKTVAYRKPSYFAAQHVFSLWDDRFPLQPLPRIEADAPFEVAAYAWTDRGSDRPGVVAWWRADEPPALESPSLGQVALPPHRFQEPLLLDLIGGTAFARPGDGTAEAFWKALPCSDAPLAIVERSLLSLPAETGADR